MKNNKLLIICTIAVIGLVLSLWGLVHIQRYHASLNPVNIPITDALSAVEDLSTDSDQAVTETVTKYIPYSIIITKLNPIPYKLKPNTTEILRV